jgi:hypothetical protein
LSDDRESHEAHTLESLAMAVISVFVGALCAIRFKVTLIVIVSVVVLFASIIVASLSENWAVFSQIIKLMVLMQFGYVASAMVQDIFRKR